MIKCPKCGFEQPPDQYCARCGINIATYKAPPVPLGRKLTGSGGFYIFLLTTVIVSTVYFIFIRTSNNVVYNTEFERMALPPKDVLNKKTNETVSNENEATNENKEGTVFGGTASTVNLKTDSDIEVTTDTEPESISVEKNAAQEKPIAAIRPKPQLTVYFLEVPQASTPTLFSGSDGGSIGVVPQFSNHKNEAKNIAQINELARESKIISTINNPIRFDQILNESTGLYIRVIPSSLSDTAMNVEIHIEYRSSATAPGSPQGFQEFDGVFTLNNNAAAYFADVLPKNAAIKPEENSIFRQHSVFKVLTSQQFISNSTEFLIFFEATGLAENP